MIVIGVILLRCTLSAPVYIWSKYVYVIPQSEHIPGEEAKLVPRIPGNLVSCGGKVGIEANNNASPTRNESSNARRWGHPGLGRASLCTRPTWTAPSNYFVL